MSEDLACTELVEMVTDYLDGTLPDAELARLRAHVTVCDGCQAHIEQVRATVRVLQTEPDEHASPELADALSAMFREWARAR